MFEQNCTKLTYTCTRATILVIVVYMPKFMLVTYREPLNTGVYSDARGGCRGACDVTAARSRCRGASVVTSASSRCWGASDVTAASSRGWGASDVTATSSRCWGGEWRHRREQQVLGSEWRHRREEQVLGGEWRHRCLGKLRWRTCSCLCLYFIPYLAPQLFVFLIFFVRQYKTEKVNDFYPIQSSEL